MGKKILYGIEDYARDKLAQESAAGRTAAQRTTPRRLGLASAANGAPGGAVYIKPATVPKQVEAPTTTGSAGVKTAEPTVTPTDATAADKPLTERELMYRDVVNSINEASKNLLNVMNRQFRYDEKSSPLYSILQKQYEREAEKAAGQAYAASVANTGGYGSSYATMAGEAARRQVMAGYDDQQLALYEAAKQEFDAERQSALDWYNTAVGMKTQAAQLVDEEKAETGVAESGMTQSASEAAQYLLNTYGVAYSEQAMRQDLLGKGYSEADVNAALESQRKMVSGAVTDYKAGDITSAVAQAETLDEAYRQGKLTVEEYDEAKAKNSKVIMESINKGMERIEDTDYRALGISEEEWNALEYGEKKLAVFDRIGQLVKSGVVNDTDYVKMLSKDLDEEFSSKEYKESDTQLRDAMDSALVIQDLYDSGYLRDDSYKYLLYEKIVPQFEGTRFWEVLDVQDKSLGEEKEYKRGSNPFNAIENYNSAQSYGSPMTAKTSKSLSHDHKELLLKIVRERRKAIREHAAGKGAKGATRA